jgi:oligoendopeptidase F
MTTDHDVNFSSSEAVPEIPPRWNLNDLFSSPDDPRIDESLAAITAGSKAFAERYKGKVAQLSPSDLRDAIAEFEQLYQENSKIGAYSGLRFAADTAPENGAFLQKMRESITQSTLPSLFFEIELSRLSLDELDTRIVAPELSDYTHWLNEIRANAAFMLSEDEERVLEEKANTGRRAFMRLFDEVTTNLRFTVEGRENPATLSEVLDLMQSSQRDDRRAASNALSAGIEGQSRTLTYIYNTLLQDKATDDRLRGYAYPEQSRHLANELTQETVDTVVRVSQEGYPLVARYYAVKKRLLGYEELFQYDRYAPLFADEEKIPFSTARDLTLSAFRDFDMTYADAAAAFFENGWIDAEPRPGKRGGAFCSYITPDKHPYIFQSYLGKMGDVRTLAHELGHGIHSYVSRKQTYLNFHGTLPMAEVASTFAEQLVFDKIAAQGDGRLRRAAYAQQIEQAFSTIFRQTALYRFEQAAHQERREKGEVPAARFGEIWQGVTNDMFGGSVTFEPGHAQWWSYIPHFISTPFYVYAYTFGEMLALALYNKYEAEGASFAPKYLAMLQAGGSQTPQKLVEPLGVDLTDENFWRGALSVLESQVVAFEQLA